MKLALLLCSCCLADCSREINQRYAVSGLVVVDGNEEKGVQGVLIEACSVNPVSVLGVYESNAPCVSQEIVHSGASGEFVTTAYSERRRFGAFSGPPHGSAEEYIYTLLIACGPDDQMARAEIQEANKKAVRLVLHRRPADDPIHKRCTYLKKR